LTVDGGWSPVEARSSWSASSDTVTGNAAARLDFAVAYKLSLISDVNTSNGPNNQNVKNI